MARGIDRTTDAVDVRVIVAGPIRYGGLAPSQDEGGEKQEAEKNAVHRVLYKVPAYSGRTHEPCQSIFFGFAQSTRALYEAACFLVRIHCR